MMIYISRFFFLEHLVWGLWPTGFLPGMTRHKSGLAGLNAFLLATNSLKRV